mmetsp:Transcript_28498/g.60471  ORF Transcript_28498/g.60471 Transcript_28498/m.60471 type:complete len:219 (-) Transcript_28498:4-660(-)
MIRSSTCTLRMMSLRLLNLLGRPVYMLSQSASSCCHFCLDFSPCNPRSCCCTRRIVSSTMVRVSSSAFRCSSWLLNLVLIKLTVISRPLSSSTRVSLSPGRSGHRAVDCLEVRLSLPPSSSSSSSIKMSLEPAMKNGPCLDVAVTAILVPLSMSAAQHLPQRPPGPGGEAAGVAASVAPAAAACADPEPPIATACRGRGGQVGQGGRAVALRCEQSTT